MLVALLSIARAQDDDPTAWHVTLTPYVWAAGIYGDVTVRGLDAEVSSSFLDVLEETDSLVGLAGHLEVTRGRLGAFGDVFYVQDQGGRRG